MKFCQKYVNLVLLMQICFWIHTNGKTLNRLGAFFEYWFKTSNIKIRVTVKIVKLSQTINHTSALARGYLALEIKEEINSGITNGTAKV